MKRLYLLTIFLLISAGCAVSKAPESPAEQQAAPAEATPPPAETTPPPAETTPPPAATPPAEPAK